MYFGKIQAKRKDKSWGWKWRAGQIRAWSTHAHDWMTSDDQMWRLWPDVTSPLLYSTNQIKDVGPHGAPAVSVVYMLWFHACACPCMRLCVCVFLLVSGNCISLHLCSYKSNLCFKWEAAYLRKNTHWGFVIVFWSRHSAYVCIPEQSPWIPQAYASN